jgi:hypothetical protein
MKRNTSLALRKQRELVKAAKASNFKINLYHFQRQNVPEQNKE